MRAKEFTNFKFDIEPYEGWTGEGVVVRAYDGKDEVGHVIFEPTEDDETQWYAVDVEVEEPYQRRGIATKMYDMAKKAAKSAGAIIVKSHTQTDAGRGLWGDKTVWEQQVNEYKEYPTREYEGVTFTMKEKDGQLIVKPLNAYGIPMGHVYFNMDGKILDPQDLEVYHKNQGQGIARVMYDYIKSQGFTIERSWDQTEAGKGFWDKHRGEDARVWEDLTTGRNLNTDTEKYVKDHKWKLTTVNPMDLDVDSFDDPYNRVIDIDVDHPVNFKDPIILDSNGVIIDGFHRAYQAQKAGLKTIPAYVPVEEQLEESRDALFSWIKQQFPTWPDYVLKDFLYQQAKGIRDQAELEDFLKRNKQDYGQVKWRLEKLPITLDIFTPKTQRMIISREGGSSNPFSVPRDAERHAQQLKMIQQQGVRTEPIIVAKLDNGYDLIEGWHRTIQHLKAFPEGYTGPAWVGYGATYQSLSESVTGPVVYHGNQGGIHRELITPMWWTEDRDTAVYYATQFNGDGWIYSAKLTCKNPYVVKPTDETNTLVEKYKTLEQQGYDSIYDPRGNDWIPFHAQDIHLVGEPEYQEGDEDQGDQVVYELTRKK